VFYTIDIGLNNGPAAGQMIPYFQ